MTGILGALLGYWLAGWLGALVGFFALQYFGRGLEQVIRDNYTDQSASSDIFFATTFSLLGYLAKADGRVSEQEVEQTEILMARLGVTGEKRQQAIHRFTLGSSPNFSFAEALNEFVAVSRFRPDMKRNLIALLAEIAMADGGLHQAEEKVLAQVARALHISQASFSQLLAMLRAQHAFAGNNGAVYQSTDTLEKAYTALGVDPNTSDKDIKKAYRKLMSQYHPDKMIAKGVPEEMLAVATEKAQEIQAAYDVIEKARK